jgi:hypothetical protein
MLHAFGGHEQFVSVFRWRVRTILDLEPLRSGVVTAFTVLRNNHLSEQTI